MSQPQKMSSIFIFESAFIGDIENKEIYRQTIPMECGKNERKVEIIDKMFT